jgi:hypothetical protein
MLHQMPAAKHVPAIIKSRFYRELARNNFRGRAGLHKQWAD